MNPARKTDSSAGFTALELLITCLVVALLIALLLPALVMSREASRRATCGSRLRQHALALQHYHHSHRQYPFGIYGDWGQSWHAAVLPFLDQPALADIVPWSDQGWWGGPDRQSDSLRRLATVVLPLKQCPAQLAGSVEHRSINGIRERAISSFNANSGNNVSKTDNLSDTELDMRQGNGPFRFHSMRETTASVVREAAVTDGLSHTVWLGEVRYRVDQTCGVCDRFYHYHPGVDDRRGWDLSEAISSMHGLPNPPSNASPLEQELAFGSFHPHGLNVVFADGAVRFTSDEIQKATWRAWGSIAGND